MEVVVTEHVWRMLDWESLVQIFKGRAFFTLFFSEGCHMLNTKTEKPSTIVSLLCKGVLPTVWANVTAKHFSLTFKEES